jgi:hypothetical protein
MGYQGETSRSRAGAAANGDGAVAGKRTLTAAMPAVQRKGLAEGSGAHPLPARAPATASMVPDFGAGLGGSVAAGHGDRLGAGLGEVGHLLDQVVRPELPPVQRKGDAPVQLSAAEVQDTAARGVASGGGAVPYREAMEAGFGTSFADVSAHTGGAAASASRAIGAEAYTMGSSVAFADANPSPQLVAHELAHVVQQRAGAGPSGGVGEVGDAFEREADAAADVVAAGGQSELAARYGGGRAGASVQQKAVQRFEANEHKQMGDEGSGKAKIKLAPGLEVSFGDITAMAGDYFESAAQLRELAAKEGDGKNVPGSRDEILFVWRVHVQHHPEEEEQYGADLRKVVKERYYRMASYNPTHFTNVEAGDEKLTHEQRAAKRGADGKPINNAGSYRMNHLEAIKAAAKAGKSGGSRDEAMLYEAFSSHYLTDAFSAGHVRSQRISVRNWWNERVPMFWTNLVWWMAEQIAKHINDNDWRGTFATVEYMWQEARATIVAQLKDKGIPAMYFGDVISGSLHDLDNSDGVMAKVGDEEVKLVGDGEVLSEQGKAWAVGVETAKKAAASVKASCKDIDDAYAKGKAGMEPDAVVEALKLADGLFRAEQLWPKALPDGVGGQLAAPKWQHETVTELFQEPSMRRAITKFANGKAEALGSEMKMEDAYKEKALQQGVLARLKGGEAQVMATFREIIDYIPDTGGMSAVGLPVIASPWDNHSDDNSMEYFKEAKAAKALHTLTSEQRFKAIQFLIKGSCDDDEEQAIIEMLDTASVAEMVSIVKRLGGGDVKKGVAYLDSGIDGAEWDDLCARVLSKSPETAVTVDDDGARAAVAEGKHNTASAGTKERWVRELLDGVCGDDDEQAIIRILSATAPADVITIVDNVGYSKVWDKVDGAESIQLTQVLKGKGYYTAMSQERRQYWVKRMSDGTTGDSAQELIVSILESIGKDDCKAIIDKVGNGTLDWDLTGSHQDRYDAVKAKHGL